MSARGMGSRLEAGERRVRGAGIWRALNPPKPPPDLTQEANQLGRIPGSDLHQKPDKRNRPLINNGLCPFIWRRVRDSNPRYVAVYLISSQAPSTTRPTLREPRIIPISPSRSLTTDAGWAVRRGSDGSEGGPPSIRPRAAGTGPRATFSPAPRPLRPARLLPSPLLLRQRRVTPQPSPSVPSAA
jgi:hypothetical protein